MCTEVNMVDLVTIHHEQGMTPRRLIFELPHVRIIIIQGTSSTTFNTKISRSPFEMGPIQVMRN